MIRLNLMCCDLPLPRDEGWINCDISDSPHIKADLLIDCTKLSDNFSNSSVDEIYIGHGLEHIYPKDVDNLFEDWKNVLKPNGILTVVVPDVDVIFDKFLKREINMEEMNDVYIYSYVQESWHRSLWNLEELRKVFTRHGFNGIEEIDRLGDPRVAYGVDWQCGITGICQK